MGLYAGHFDWSKPLLWTVPGVLSQSECQELITKNQGAEWLAATVNSFGGRVVDAKIRDNDTAIIRDDALADLVYQRLLPHIPKIMSRERGSARVEVEACGVFTPMRVYRYHPGQRFGLHQDQSYSRESDGAQSFLTLIIYLNADYAGGETDFPEQKQKIIPQQGLALLFQHMLLHAGLPVVAGIKYLLRSDVMYR